MEKGHWWNWSWEWRHSGTGTLPPFPSFFSSLPLYLSLLHHTHSAHTHTHTRLSSSLLSLFYSVSSPLRGKGTRLSSWRSYSHSQRRIGSLSHLLLGKRKNISGSLAWTTCLVNKLTSAARAECVCAHFCVWSALVNTAWVGCPSPHSGWESLTAKKPCG